MRKLTEEQVQNIPSKPMGKHGLARALLLKMKLGDYILLERKEWFQKKKSPVDLIRRMRKSKGMDFSCETALDGSGWIIKRLK